MGPESDRPGDLRASGTSLGNLWELILPLLDAVGARSVAEVGAFGGELTADLLDWAEEAGANVIAIDPEPTAELLRLGQSSQRLELIGETSLVALPQMAMTDVVIIDGDHNYYTVSQELRAIEAQSHGALPLVMFHDVGWPLARRDTYHAPDRIPSAYRQPLLPDTELATEPGDFSADHPFAFIASVEGGPRNGVLTAIEDFLAERSGIRFAVVPAFFGFAVLWRIEAPWAAAVAEIVGPFDRHPVLQRLERDRVMHLLLRQGNERHLAELEREVAELRRRLDANETA
jgi:Methyltransferase domain